jgi:hypothetical protein
MHKMKEFKTPTQEPVRVMSPDGMVISWVYPEWRPIQESLWASAYSQGCISKDMSRIGADPVHAVALEKAKEAAFRDQVKKTMIEIMEEGDPEQMDAYGKPKVDVIGDIIGTYPTGALRNEIFKEIKKETK